MPIPNVSPVLGLADSIRMRLFRFLLPSLVALCLAGCDPCGPFVVTYVVRGTVIDTQTGEGIEGAPIYVWLLKESEFLPWIHVRSASVTSALTIPAPPVTAPDGSFAEAMSNGERMGSEACAAPAPGTLEPVVPDQIRIIVGLPGCLQEVFVDIGEETVVDLSFPDGVIELSAPVEIPPCAAAEK